MEIPDSLIYKRDPLDFVGTKIELVRVTQGTCATAYYARMNGSRSSIHAIPKGHIHTIVEGKDHQFFTTYEQLHQSIEKQVHKTLDSINRFRNIGSYFK